MSREKQAFNIRVAAADLAKNRGSTEQTPRGDNDPNLAGSFTKGLPHVQNTGLIVDRNDYTLFVNAINTGDFGDIADIPLGPNLPDDERFISGISRGNGNINDQENGIADVRAWESMAAGNTFDLEGPDAQSLAMPAHPAIDSKELIAEMAEVYWMALLRDVPFSRFDTNYNVQRAVGSLNATDWIGFNSNPPANLSREERDRLRGPFTRDTIFRGVLKGDDVGPYISQFLLAGTRGVDRQEKPADGFITYGAQRIDQRVRFATPNRDYMTTWASWLDVQNGADVRGRETYDKGFRFITTPRDLATFVHFDALYQAYLNTCLILLALKAPFDNGIPFRRDDDKDKQEGFALWGGPHILTLVTEVATRALKGVWFQKFNVHRRPRPEALAGLIERFRHEPGSDLYKAGAALFEGLDKDLLSRIAKENGETNRNTEDLGNPRSADFDPRGATGENILLPMAFPEGSPMHPSYGSGHATVAGACVTILKAWFKTDWKLPFAFEASRDGSRLVEVKPKINLTLEGELNKICSNISIGRNWAGVHYFTDYFESIKIGEEIAIGILEEQALTYPDRFSMSFNKFNDEPVTITNKKH